MSKPTPKKAARRTSRKAAAKPQRKETANVGYLPAKPFVWPTIAHCTRFVMSRHSEENKPYAMADGSAAERYQASFFVANEDGSASTTGLPPVGGLCPVGTPLAEIERLALAECHQVLRRSGALNGAPK